MTGNGVYLHENPTALLLAILGPLVGFFEGDPIDFGPFKQRVTLAILLCHVNRATPIEALYEGLWGDSGPRTALKNIQAYVSALRKTLARYGLADRIVSIPPGYRLELNMAELDSLRFDRLAREGRVLLRDGDHMGALSRLDEALPLWRGTAFADLRTVPMLREESERMERRWLAAWEDWSEAGLEIGNHREVLERLEDIVPRFPLRERLRRLYMLALYRNARKAEALEAFDELRMALARELGLAPSPALEQFYRQILVDDRNLEPHQGDVASSRHAEVVAHVGGLPRNVEDFSGREAVLADLVDRFTRREPGAGQVAVISGPAGVGKSTLALRVAQVVRAHYPDGQVFVSLRHADGRPRNGPEALSELLWNFYHYGADINDASMLRNLLAQSRILLILDGAADEGVARLLLTWSGVRHVLVTSTRRMSGLEAAHHVDLQPFTTEESLRLLSQVSGVPKEERRDSLKRIVRACGHLPAAVRLAGVRLAARPHIDPDRVVRRLEDDTAVLHELVAGDSNIRDHLARHVGDLRTEERAFLEGLVIVATSPFGVKEVEVTLGLSTAAAERSLERLLEANVIAPVADSVDDLLFEMPRLLRVFAAEIKPPRR